MGVTKNMVDNLADITKLKAVDTSNFVLKTKLTDCNGTRTQNHLVRKRTLNHLAKLAQMIELCCEFLSVRCI